MQLIRRVASPRDARALPVVGHLVPGGLVLSGARLNHKGDEPLGSGAREALRIVHVQCATTTK